MVQAFWAWCDRQCHRPDLLPSSPLAKALHYALARTASLQVFLADPEVAIDTNHLERAPCNSCAWLLGSTFLDGGSPRSLASGLFRP